MADQRHGRRRLPELWQIRRLRDIGIACAIAVSILIVTNVAVQLFRSRSKPLFSTFMPAGIVSRWSPPHTALISEDWRAYVDLEDRVILLIPCNRLGSEWLPQTKRSEALVIRSGDDRKEIKVDWRRNAIIQVDVAGNARYFELSASTFDTLKQSGLSDRNAVRDAVEKYIPMGEPKD
jgi:hypothetical protein